MYNLLTKAFYPYLDEKGQLKQVPLEDVLLGECECNPKHPDPAIEAFLRYVPSLILQVLEPKISKEEWIDLVQHGRKASCYSDYKKMIRSQIDEKEDFFTQYPDKSGFYQHYDVKIDAEKEKSTSGSSLKIGLDGFLLHFATGNNHCHHKQPGILSKICPSCALLSLMHHDYFCVAGLAGPANLRGNQAYLCLIHKDDPFSRMIANTFLSIEEQRMVMEKQGWVGKETMDQPSWHRTGNAAKKGFEDQPSEIGLLRAMLYTPRHAFFDIEEKEAICDFCGFFSTQLVEKYYWRIGEKRQGYVGHPTLATYFDEKQKLFLPQNYNPSLWRSLSCLILENFERDKKQFIPAPLIQQYQTLLKDAGKGRSYTLELQAYQTDKAKLLGFQYQTIDKLPVFEDADQKREFFELFSAFTTAVADLLSGFRYFGSADKKKTKEAIPRINDRHRELTLDWGNESLQKIQQYREWQLYEEENQIEDFLANKFAEELDRYCVVLINKFEALCEVFAWDDYTAQKKLQKQKRMLTGTLNKVGKEFRKKFSEGE